MLLPVYRVFMKSQIVGKGRIVDVISKRTRLLGNALVCPFSSSSGRRAHTCPALLFRKHGDPSQVVK